MSRGKRIEGLLCRPESVGRLLSISMATRGGRRFAIDRVGLPTRYAPSSFDVEPNDQAFAIRRSELPCPFFFTIYLGLQLLKGNG